ncbi:YihY/virulence factor BrkB family protein [Sulfitobacter geojensis]|jgi:membrane protein|uniref:YihY/virulence factor BrkB family protein n=1 Tax=Sulfitobacter geojensis TaxID=1342299 RepID=A0AAE2VYP5_9RHOB|nr:YihY/virulence factor BrkB family protein [Sulfitobacter geojensis]MBM1689486.1 YihY/virulence factor BrkB family protein [Sulfitobacter geojensis]MBM1693552.1 YihY/virulence factor BrkB family protein [Sulfitobacter geojensis]MBM1705718.1 YihY/virulence factor BrkB family protein [Sulfitobacter geojensis]MBM1709776.1 YihY/virulence factor BrkB family protein [Sulfitobacter geojensis]MBM1713842.1 YihY/virulence factor BrkB family protein [Sulfitobacter geojensis]
MQISRLGFRGYWDVFKSSVTQIGESNLALVSAGVAFFSMLSLFPALAALIAMAGIIADPAEVVAQLEDLRELMPADVFEIIHQQVVSLVSASSDTLGWAGVVSLFLALWSARAGVGAMIIGLNSVYFQPNRNTAWHYLRALMLTAALVGVGLVALISLVVIPVLLAFFPLGLIGTLLIDGLRWIVAIVVLFAGVGLLYRYGPNRKVARFRWLSAGAIVAVALWVILSLGFSYYVTNFGNYNQVYGSIGAVVAMLIWLWITSFLVLYGAALNAQIEAWLKENHPVTPLQETF